MKKGTLLNTRMQGVVVVFQFCLHYMTVKAYYSVAEFFVLSDKRIK